MNINDPRIFALKDLATFCQGFIPSRICAGDYEPTRDDAKDLVNDLHLIARKVDNLIEAYGQYCEQNGFATEKDVKNDFSGQLLGALDGNATFVIEDGIDAMVEARRETAV